ncbi:hypothetical protein CGRA01v4_14815 [Colletotrichum graminicola]|nr:hypothetical protein CGRA01v4_14815 [Colletotrichum graminicola]
MTNLVETCGNGMVVNMRSLPIPNPACVTRKSLLC